MKKPETVADAVKVIARINTAIDESYEAIDNNIATNNIMCKISIDEDSLRTLKQAAEWYVDKLGKMEIV